MFNSQQKAKLANKSLSRDVEQARRIYDPQDERDWGMKYRNFSGDHMKRAYRTYAEARHDPFNKSPSWGPSVVRKIGEKLLAEGLAPIDQFLKLDVSGNGLLEREEVRRLFLKSMPELGDIEIAAVFNMIDEDNSGAISIDELERLFPKTTGEQDEMREHDKDEEKHHFHRTPIHRVKRLPPAIIEGWDHLHGQVQNGQETERLKTQEQLMFRRLGSQLSTPRSPMPTPTEYSKYNNFGGGCDAARFQKNQLRKDMRDYDGSSSVSQAVSSVPDPGGLDLKPGYHYELTRLCPQYALPSARRSGLTPRVGASSASSATQRMT